MAAENVTKPLAKTNRPTRVHAVRITRPSRRRRYASVAAGIYGVVGLLAALTDSSGWVITDKELVIALSILLTPLCLLVALTTSRPKLLEACSGVARVTREKLEITGTAPVAVARADIAEGWFVDPDELHLKKRDGEEITMALSEPQAGPRLLTSLGLGPTERALRLTLASPAERLPFGSLAATVVAFVLSPAVLVMVTYAHYIATDHVWHPPVSGEVPRWVAITALLASTLVLSLLALCRGEATVGADGVFVRTLLRRRFYPYARLGAIRAELRSVRLEVVGERPVLFALGAWRFPGAPAFDEIRRQHAALARRIRKALAASTSSDALPHTDLDRAGRSATAWRADLAKLAKERPSYRETSIAAEELAAVVESASMPAERRVAAAVVLAHSARDQAARAVRAAIDASADDDLRAALKHAAEGDLDERVLQRRA